MLLRGLSLATVCGALLVLAGAGAGLRLPRFEDRTAKSGITFRHHGNPTPAKYLMETMGGGVAVFDYDNDGLLDVFFVNSGSFRAVEGQGFEIDRSKPSDHDRLYRNRGGGRFEDVTAQAGISAAGSGVYGMGAAAGDIDNDGFVDLYVTGFDRNILYRNRGDGTFEDVTAKAGVAGGGWSASAGFFDYDRDGDLDLFVTRYLDWDLSKHRSCGTDAFKTYCPPVKHDPIDNLLYRNNGDGTFTGVSEPAGIAGKMGKNLGVSFNDYNADGWVDIAVANDSVAQLLFENNGDGTFSEVALETGFAYTEDGGVYSGMGIDFEDYDNDGRPDILISNLAKEHYAVYRNEGGVFAYRTRQSRIGKITALMSGWGMRLFDFDLDGWKDLFVAQSHVLDNVERLDRTLVYRQPPLLALNEQGRFTDVSQHAGAVFQRALAGRGAAFGDLDNDGGIDVVMSVLHGPPVVLFSAAPEKGGHWLTIHPVGAASNRDGLDARVRITTASGEKQWGFASRADSYLSANDRRVHFGLGGEDRVREVEILWPSGIRQVLEDVAADQILKVTEPPKNGRNKGSS